MKEKISFIIPVYNEESNIENLYSEIKAVAQKLDHPYETIFVDDFSSDNSLSVIKKLSKNNSDVRYVSFAKNCGQSAALYAGFQHATGEIIITMDGDLQNDPGDIPNMIKMFGEYDMITGWRKNRRDTLSKKIASKIGNFIRNSITKDNIHDTGCSLKIMRASMVKKIKMYRGLHRFLPLLMKLEGAKIVEIPVNHRERLHGVSKYNNLSRAIEGLYDLVAVRWMMKRHLDIPIKEKK